MDFGLIGKKYFTKAPIYRRPDRLTILGPGANKVAIKDIGWRSVMEQVGY